MYGAKVDSDEGVRDSRNWVAVGPRKLGGCESDYRYIGQVPTLLAPYARHRIAQHCCGRDGDLLLHSVNRFNETGK